VSGQIVYHKKYGDQLHATHCKLTQPKGSLIKHHLQTHQAYRGIGLGPVKIGQLCKRFGDGLLPILERGDISALSGVLTQETAKRLVEVWRVNAFETSVIAFLDQHRIDSRFADKILRLWGVEVIEKLRENPYRLLVIMEWKHVDEVANALGIKQLDHRRLIAAVEACLYSDLDRRRNTLVDENRLLCRIRKLTAINHEETLHYALQLSISENAVVRVQRGGYQALGCAVMEQFIAERFTKLLQDSSSKQLDLYGVFGKNSLVDRCILEFEIQEKIELNIEQRRAVHMASTCSLSILKGGAGVGKTTVLKVIFKTVKAMGHKVFQMALAGRAAQRMREMTGEDAYTIVGFLNRIQHREIAPQPGDIIVIDESSMLDLLLTYRLVRALPFGVRLLFVGDPNQLPPIGPGLIFHVLASSSSVPTTELIKIHRQAASTGIPQVAELIRNGHIPTFNEYCGKGAGVSFVDCDAHTIVDHLQRIVEDLGANIETQILGTLKATAAGTQNINQIFHDKNQTPSRARLSGWNFAENDPIIFVKNDYERDLFNGSLGYLETVISQEAGNKGIDAKLTRAIGNFEGRQVELSSEDLNHIELAYAITVHKSQGSQFQRVIIPITPSRLLDRTLIYTALTRGVEQVVFLGNRGALNEAIVTPPSASLRSVGFSI
jgi:exodeoxyribonuclease V alpha subunit